MTTPLPLLLDDELSRTIPLDDDSGFGALATERGPLPLKALDVQARIDGLVSEVSVRQTFVNAFDVPLEATYIFPLPDRAAVQRFRLEVAGRVVEGALKERGQARQEYDQAIRQGHRAAIAEEERPGVFTLRVGNLPPGEAATVELTLSGPLPCDDGEVTFRFPLVVAPRYIPGTPLPGTSVGDGTALDTDAAPDASRISPPVLLPGYPNPVRLSLTVDVAPSDIPVGQFRCSLHSVFEARDDAGGMRIVLQAGERLDRDFILRFRLGDGALRSALSLRPDGPGEGTFLLTLLASAAPEQRRPRDVIFVLDRSGSMRGWKMVAARRAIAGMVDTLTGSDRFAVYAFDDRLETPAGDGSLVPAGSPQRYAAVQFLEKIDARGGTEMAQPLTLAVHALAGGAAARDRIVVLVTDGQVGNEDQILQSLGQQARSVRIFALGIDQAVNAGFLRRLADLGGGSCELVESEDRLAEVMDSVHRRIATPALTDLRIAAEGFEIVADTLTPARSPDLFVGSPLCLMGRYRGDPAGAVTVHGRTPNGEAWAGQLTPRRSESVALAALWARGHIRDLEDRFAIQSAPELERRIIDTSLRFGVLSRFTAFVAVDRAAVVNEGGEVHRVTQAVETPAGWGACERNRSPKPTCAPTGRACLTDGVLRSAASRASSPETTARYPQAPNAPPAPLTKGVGSDSVFGESDELSEEDEYEDDAFETTRGWGKSKDLREYRPARSRKKARLSGRALILGLLVAILALILGMWLAR